MEKMSVSDYMKLNYSIIVTPYDEEGQKYFYGRVLELEGCQSTGDTIEELNESIKEAMELYIETLLEKGWDVPVPDEKKYSGKVLLRMPSSLHRRLVQEANMEGVSFNTLAVAKLAR